VVSASQTAARAGASAAGGATRIVHRLTGASGAARTGLGSLIELTAASSIGDAFVLVALAGTLFFSVSVDQARPKVVLALLITIAPYAVLAPFIGPMLDKVQQGRRYILAGTLLARGLLCWGMAVAVQHNDPADLLPAAFGILVLQQAFGVTRSAIAPRLLPAEITLVTANSRTTLAVTIAGTIGGGLAAGIDLVAGGGQGGGAWVLRIGTVAYLAAMALCLRLPDVVDSPQAAPARLASNGAGAAAGPDGHAPGARGPRGPQGTMPLPRPARRPWRLPRLGPVVGDAMGADIAQRAFSGFMFFFLVFLLRAVHFGTVPDKLALSELVGATLLGGFLGPAIGSGLKSRAPQFLVFGMPVLTAIAATAAAVFFGLWAALAVAVVAGIGQALVKLGLDSIVQREIGEEVRSSTFAASQTLHQLSYVAGGLAGLAMSLTDNGVAGMSVGAGGLALAMTVLLLRRRRRILDNRRHLPRPRVP
jgi:MFS family permease